MYLLLTALAGLFIALSGTAQNPQILLDEEFEEWAALTNHADGNNGAITGFKLSHTPEFLMMYLQRADQFSLQNKDNTAMYLDTDMDASTGKAIHGIGAEIAFQFGTRSGTVYLDGESHEIGAATLFLVSSPTVRSDRFELSLDLNAKAEGQKLFNGTEVRVLLEDKANNAFAPAAEGGVSYSLAAEDPQPLPPYQISKKAPQHLRTASLNVEFDGFFEAAHKPSFKRLLKAIKPDILGLQEIYEHSNAEVATRMEEILPTAANTQWNTAHVQDNFIATRYDILEIFAPGGFGNGAFLVDLRPDFNTNMLVFVTHPPCCDNDADRQKEVDAMAAFLRNAKTEGGDLHIAEETPVLFLGDMNFVGDPANVATLLEGDIVDEATYGSDFNPDWDGSSLEDAKPYTTHLPMTFTQGNSEGAGSYSKGRLDYIMYSGSVMEQQNSYVLYTHNMPADSLEGYGLEAYDTETASDHFPLVADFSLDAEPLGDQSLLPLRQNDANGLPLYMNQTVTVSGTVTSAAAFGSAGPAFMQDEGAGIALYGQEIVQEINAGDSITLTAQVSQYNGLTQLTYNAAHYAMENTARDIPGAKEVSAADILGQAWDYQELLEGQLVELRNVRIAESGDFAGNTVYTIEKGTHSLNLLIDSDTDIPGNAIPGDLVHITGLVSQYDTDAPYSSGYQLLPRSMNDFTEAAVPQASVVAPQQGERVKARTSYTIEWNNAHVEALDIAYQVQGESAWERIAGDVDASTGSYSWQVPPLTDSLHLRLQNHASGETLATSGYFFVDESSSLAAHGPHALQVRILRNPPQKRKTLQIKLPAASRVQLNLFHPSGRKIMPEQTFSLPAGMHRYPLPQVKAAGLYICRIQTTDGVRAAKFMVH